MPYVDPISLRDALNRYYNEAEIEDLCFELSIDYESLGGRGKAGNVRELVNYAIRNGRYEEIVVYVRRTRSHVKLEMVATPPALPEAVERPTSGSTTNIYQAPVYQGDINNLATEGGAVNESKKKVEVKAKQIIGNIGDGDFNNEGNIAGRDIILGGRSIPQTREEFNKQLQALQELLNQAVAQQEFDKARDGEKAQTAVADVAEEIAQEEPDKITITTRLNELKTRLEGATKVVEAAGKTGTAILKATPIVKALIKLAQAIF